MNCLLLLSVVVAVADLGLAQVHLGPIGDAQTVECYHCDARGHRFPACLSDPHVCHHDEVCKITYGHGEPHVSCQKKHDCDRETEHPMRDCTGGGVEVRHNECQKCCGSSTCVSDLTDLLKIEMQTSPNLMCPGECDQNDIQRCVDNSRMCLDGQFCQVSKDDHGKIKGECKNDHDYHHCLDEQAKHPCDHAVGHGHGHHGKCFWDCCVTSTCLNTHFGAYMSTGAPNATAMPESTTAMPQELTTVSGQSLWERLNGDCKDQLAGDQCQMLMQTQDVCRDRLALSICPDSCGLCDAINSTACADTVLNNGCQDLLVNEDVCSDDVAVFICPNTCNLCSELINSIITSIVNGSSQATDVPPSLLPPSANPSDFPTFNCNDLNNMTCGVLDSLCGTSFVSVVCPDNCAVCTDAIFTATVGLDITQAPTTEMLTTEVPTTEVPTTTSEVLTTADNMPGSTADALCSDHLNGMDCSQLKDVCGSVMALSVCPKYCGLC